MRHFHGIGECDDLDFNVFSCFQSLADLGQILGDVGMHEFIGESRRCVERAEFAQALRGVAGLLLKFTHGGEIGLFAGLEFACGELPKAIVHGDAVVAYHDDVVGVERRNDDHGSWVPHHFAADRAAACVGPRQSLDLEQRPLMDGFDATPVIHQDDDRSFSGIAAPVKGEARRTHSAVATARAPIVQLKDVHKSFAHQRVLRGISLEFATGQTTVVLGPSGCGKSVMLKHIIGLLRPDTGEVWFDGSRIDELRESQLVDVRRQVGFLFQMGALFDSMSVRDNIAFPLAEHTQLTAEQIDNRVMRVLGVVGLKEVVNKMPADLSGGQRKRIALARAIVLEPKVILYDEPTTGLDPIRSDVINELILKLQRELRVTSIVVTHDLASAFKVADHMVMLHEGRVCFRGTPEELRQSEDPIVRQFLRGEASEEDLAGIRAMHEGDAGRDEGELDAPKERT